MTQLIKVAVIMGGISSEHDVSLMSGKEIIRNLDKKKYLPYPVVIDKDGKGLTKLISNKPDIALIALHGKGGEDGTIQGFLQSIGVRYTGSGILASAIGMDKLLFRELMRVNRIPVPKSYSIAKNTKKIIPGFALPYFVKPYNGGSSLGVSYVANMKDLDSAIKAAFKYSDKVIIEKCIKGLEVSCAVIGNENPIALPVIEIHPLKGKFFDYNSKYKEKGSEETVPAQISVKITNMIKKMSIKIYKLIGCSGYARIDYILEKGVNPIVLEINTLPGMTGSSLLPKEAKAVGISYSNILDVIINLALGHRITRLPDIK